MFASWLCEINYDLQVPDGPPEGEDQGNAGWPNGNDQFEGPPGFPDRGDKRVRLQQSTDKRDRWGLENNGECSLLWHRRLSVLFFRGI